MFADHNGHELATLAEVCLIVKQNIDDLQKLIMNTKRINEDNKSYVTHVQDNLQRLRENQIANVEKGFAEIISQMEQKRDTLVKEFTERYDAAEGIYGEKQVTLTTN